MRTKGGQRWQPIETAKKDGTEYLLWYPPERKEGSSGPGLESGGAIQGWWHDDCGRTDEFSDSGWETVIGFIGEPTHWMLLIKPDGP